MWAIIILPFYLMGNTVITLLPAGSTITLIFTPSLTPSTLNLAGSPFFV